MTQQKVASPEEKLEEAAKAVELHKIHEDDFFKTLGNSTEFDILCNGIDTKVGLNHKEAKKLCTDLVHRLEKLSKDNPPKQNDYCSYLRFWLYEKIGEIHTDKSGNIDNVPFFKYLIEPWKKMNSEKLKSKCAPEELKGVKLSELKNRIFSYIYFKNLEKIKTISPSKNQDNCTKSKSFRRHNRIKSSSSRSKFIEFVNCCNYVTCSKYNQSNNSVNSSYNHKHSKNNKCSHYNKYGNYKFIKSTKLMFIEFVNCCNYVTCSKYNQSNNSVNSSYNHKHSKNNKCSHYNKYGNYKFIKSTKLMVFVRFIFFTKITNFYKYIEYNSFNKASYYNRYIKCKRFGGYSNHKFTKGNRFNKFNRSRGIKTSIGCRRRTWKIFEFPVAKKPWVRSTNSNIK
ncbi:hypothetical protein PVNG_06344 [Plasmodium vivax North Korean]|uniref:PIR Superfamily Protein n=1 Tax=Plasmodium vivax North Korean TaxID=1035514 RepID=A0A0J9W762_PLAVI|nr:hypothetical protein PVNG_06344 [Plasmodium vivax North Korean]